MDKFCHFGAYQKINMKINRSALTANWNISAKKALHIMECCRKENVNTALFYHDHDISYHIRRYS